MDNGVKVFFSTQLNVKIKRELENMMIRDQPAQCQLPNNNKKGRMKVVDWNTAKLR